jgi:hypothetical protein
MSIQSVIIKRLAIVERWISQHTAKEPTNSTCQVYQTGGTFPLASAVTTTITFDTDEYDPDDLHSVLANTDRITILVPGVYVLSANGRFDKGAGTWRVVYITVNAADVISQSITNTVAFDARLSATGQKRLAAGDIVRMQAYQNSGGQININDPILAATRIA